MQKTITAFEIPAIDFDRAVKFYSAVLGGKVNIVDFVGHEGLKKVSYPTQTVGSLELLFVYQNIQSQVTKELMFIYM